MIIFAADNHYGVHPGLCAFEEIRGAHPDIIFSEDDWSIFNRYNLAKDCELLILNMIGSTCGNPLPDEEACLAVKRYCETGKNLLLLHGSSAAFWHCSWFRENSGLRWVRPGDPDEIPQSVHPVEPYTVKISKTRHPLCKKLVEMDFSEADEIYTVMEQTQPLWILMQTTISSGTHPMLTESVNQWGGKVINFMPGHKPSVTRHPDYIQNLKTLIAYLRNTV